MIVKSRLNWLPYKLGDIAEVVTGSTPSSERSELYGNDVPFVTPADLDSREIIIKTKRGLSKLGAIEARILPPETILVCCIGATIGKVGFGGTTLATNQQINSLVINQDLAFPKFVYHYCRTIKPIILANSTSTTLPIINKSRFSELPIFLPPLAEQKRIAAILDKADAIRRKRQEAIRLADELLRSVFLDMFGDPVSNLKGWEIQNLESLISQPLRNGTSPSTEGKYYGRVLMLSAITGKGFNSSSAKSATFAKEFIDSDLVDSRDFLICRGNGNLNLVGRGCFPTYSMSDVIFADTMIAARFRESMVEKEYIEVVWNSSFVRSQIEKAARTTNGTYKINQTMVEAIKLPLPPKQMQEQFSKISMKIRTISQSWQRTYDQDLFNSLVQRAFRGEL
ncbi:MAG: restriction endonuclease subunit S [Blastocatellia bacterium]